MKCGLLMTVLALFVFVACDNGGGATPTAPPAQAAAPQRTESGVPGPLLPRAKSSKDVDPAAHSGHELFITDDALVPKQLFSVLNATLLFINETDEDVKIHFVNVPYQSDIAVEAGGRAEWKLDSGGSTVVEVKGDQDRRAAIQVDDYYEPGETASPSADDP